MTATATCAPCALCGASQADSYPYATAPGSWTWAPLCERCRTTRRDEIEAIIEADQAKFYGEQAKISAGEQPDKPPDDWPNAPTVSELVGVPVQERAHEPPGRPGSRPRPDPDRPHSLARHADHGSYPSFWSC